ncbi:MAG: hypothetical protein H6638_01785 [Ardenticatenales bacterium]|nr:hypothetical protein [Ardenticatenales bacterium]
MGLALTVDSLFDVLSWYLGDERKVLTTEEGGNVLPEVCLWAEFEPGDYGYPRLIVDSPCESFKQESSSYEVLDFQPMP